MVDRKSSVLRGKVPQCSSQLEAIAQLFAVLAETSRLQILKVLEEGARSVTELCEITGMKQANVSKQLGVLHSAGLLERSRQGNLVRYAIRMQLVFKLCDLVCGELHRDAVARVEALAAVRGSRD